MRLLILQMVFLVSEVWPQFSSHLGMQINVWLVHKHPSCLRSKDPVYQKNVYFIVPSTVAVLAVKLLQCQNGGKL